MMEVVSIKKGSTRKSVFFFFFLFIAGARRVGYNKKTKKSIDGFFSFYFPETGSPRKIFNFYFFIRSYVWCYRGMKKKVKILFFFLFLVLYSVIFSEYKFSFCFFVGSKKVFN